MVATHASEPLYAQVVVLTHAYGQRYGVRFLTNGLKVVPMHADTLFPKHAFRSSACVQVYYAPRQPVHCQVVLPTLFGGFRLLRNILIREGITLVHAHQAFSVMGHEAILQARTMGYKARHVLSLVVAYITTLLGHGFDAVLC